MSRFWKIALIVVALIVVALVGFRLLHKPGEGAAGEGRHRQGAGQDKQSASDKGANGQDNGPVPVTVEPVTKQNVPVYLTALGTVQALNTVTVNAQVAGQMLSINFKEGQPVTKGQVLAQIDPRTFQAAYDQAAAKQKQDEALLGTAQSTLKRNQALVANGYVAALDMDTFRNNVAQLEATVVADAANVRSTKVQLDFTKIISPIDGVAGIRNVDPGNVVTTTTAIDTLTQIQPIYVVFNLPEVNLEMVRGAAKGTDPLEVIALDRADAHPLDTTGVLQVVDNQIDITTGTFKLRAQFANPTSSLWPGQFVNVQLKVRTVAGGLVVPAQAVQRGPDGDYVYLVQSDQTVKMQPVKLAGEVGDSHVMISSGLSVGEQVVTEGQFRLKPGSKVNALKPGQVPATPSSAELDKAKKNQSGGKRHGQ
ncbi:MAG: efflux RND transporter periplasmic adaptor subunit [Rhodanobacter sp.]